MNSNSAVFFALLRRDLHVMKKNILGDMIDAMIYMVITLIVFGKLLPLIGMKPAFIAPLYIGSSLFFTLATRGYALAMTIVYKIAFENLGLFGYHLTLPIDRKWLFAEYVTYFVIETCILTLPLLLIGTYILTTFIDLTIYSWPLFLCMYLLMVILFGLFFIGSAFTYSFHWFRANLWPRRIDFFMVFSSTFFPWQAVHNFSPIVSYIMLLNPITYAMEGMRNALFGTPIPIPLWFCMLVMVMSIGICGLWLHAGIRKTIDPI